jgi:UDP-2-acetamido-2,6-beta-L-arabino-hexul-4-ose reductase
MRVLITGAEGFIGKNLRLHLAERRDVDVLCFTRENTVQELTGFVAQADFIFHLAGVNRPQDPQDFVTGNLDLTQELATEVAAVAARTGRKAPVLYTSSTQAWRDNAYGQSKARAEQALLAALAPQQVPSHIFRLPNVFGKWCKPNYNSAVATFCHNIARDLPIQVNDPGAAVTLVYIDDVIRRFVELMDGAGATCGQDGIAPVEPQYTITVGELAKQIQAFRDSRSTLMTDRVGMGLARALYATYVSYLPAQDFAYAVPQHADPRGVFVEMLKTPDCGQFSFFTAHPGVTRGGHYHHTKTEKFLVIKGQARFKFRHMQTGERQELMTSGAKAEIVETVPGWTHDITNIGDEEMVVMLWANEVFDRARPDTFAAAVDQ